MPKNIRNAILLVIFAMVLLSFSACDNINDSSIGEVNDINNITIDKDSKVDVDTSSDSKEPNVEEANQTNNQGIAFVQQDYFYKDTVYLELVSDRPCDIYYTMDGSEPDKSKSLYQDKIELKSGSQVKVYSIKAKGYFRMILRRYNSTYLFCGKECSERFSTLIFSITSDPIIFMIMNMES